MIVISKKKAVVFLITFIFFAGNNIGGLAGINRLIINGTSGYEVSV